MKEETMIVKNNEGPSILLWLDLEMTGLNVDKEVILEIASVITDVQLNIMAYGPDLVIHQSSNVLERMDSWCKVQHKKSGLTEHVEKSNVTVAEAEQETLHFVKQHAPPNTVRLCGNSIWQDRLFLAKYMPNLLNYLNYRLIDVSSVKEVIRAWYPKNSHAEFKKKDLHRALPDVLESIEELKQYRKYFFIKHSG